MCNHQLQGQRHFRTSEWYQEYPEKRHFFRQHNNVSRHLGRKKKWQQGQYCWPHFKTGEMWQKTKGFTKVTSVAYGRPGVQSKMSRFVMYLLDYKAILPLQEMIYWYINVHWCNAKLQTTSLSELMSLIDCERTWSQKNCGLSDLMLIILLTCILVK